MNVSAGKVSWSDWANFQLLYALKGYPREWNLFMQTMETLISLGKYAGWQESSLGDLIIFYKYLQLYTLKKTMGIVFYIGNCGMHYGEQRKLGRGLTHLTVHTSSIDMEGRTMTPT